MLVGPFLLGSCASGTGKENARKQKNALPTALPTYVYSVYLENSGSLNGYLLAPGDSNFKSNVYHLISTLNGLPDKKALNLYDINTQTIPVALNADAAKVSDYLKGLDAAVMKARSKAAGGNQSQSNLQQIFQTILDKSGAEEISLLVTDGIFSPGRKGNAEDFLSQQRSSIHVFMAEKLRRRPFSTLVLQFHSDFNGTYYYQDNSTCKGSFKERPYYVICFGPQEALFRLWKKVQEQTGFSGYREFLFLTDSNQYQVASRIRNAFEYYEYDPDEQMAVREMRRGGRDNKYRIKLSANFSRLPLNDAYLVNRANYSLSPGFIIDSIYASGQRGFTHELILSTLAARSGTITLSLKKQLPAWIAATNLDDDRSVSPEELRGRTFGIRYLLEGIYNAYAAAYTQPFYYSLSISVKE